MKSINNFILEKLKLNRQSKLKKEWSIEDAKNGDIITINVVRVKIKYICIFKCIEPDKDVSETPVIRIYGYYNCVTKYFVIMPPTHYFGNLHDVELKRNICSLSTEEEKQKLFEAMKYEGYEWDEKKKELKEI